MDLDPKVPENLHPLAREVLEELRLYPESEAIIIGGGVALQHYCDFRRTVDLDAWWQGRPGRGAESAILEAMENVARRHGFAVAVRTWREVQSYELTDRERKVFSFQIAERTAPLDVALQSAWPPVKIETFRDNLGAKMNALVDRGAPRDFLDLCEICRRGLATVADCWETWAKKNSKTSPAEGRVRVLHHLGTLEARRPLETISSAEERASAGAVRRWVRESLCEGEGTDHGD